MVLPEGMVLPPWGYLIGVLIATILVGWAAVQQQPPITQWTVVALLPWMAVGGGLHVIWAVELAPEWLLPLFGAPLVYLTMAVLAATIWVVTPILVNEGLVDHALGISGLIGFVAITGWLAWNAGTPALVWPMLGVIGSITVTGVVWAVFYRLSTETARITAWAGLAVIFSHVLDGISTLIGMDLLQWGERTPLPRMIMEAAGLLPTADYIGVGWLFLLVKIVLATGVLWLFQEFVRESPTQAYLLLAILAAVGMGPGVHNLLLFMVGA